MDAAPRLAPDWNDGGALGYRSPMIPDRRRLAGTVLLLLLVVVYVFVAAIVGEKILPKAGRIAEFVYYAVAGLAWVPLAAMIISWMHKT